MSKFYDEYREQREKQSITLEEISERTKINIQFLRAIEEGNFEVLPETYTRLFLRAYANEIGIDPDKAIENYDLMHGKPVEEKPKQPEKPVQEFSAEPPKEPPSSQRLNLRPQRSFNWKQSLIVVLVFAFVLWAVKSYVGSNNEPEQQTPPVQKNEQVTPVDTTADTTDTTQRQIEVAPDEPKSAQSRPQQQQQNTETSGTASRTTTDNSQSTGFTLRLNATQRTWVRVQRDSLPSNEFTFYGNDSKTWHAQNEIQLMIGNAAGAQLQVGSKRYTSLGAPNEVVSVRLTNNGIVEQHTIQPNPQTTNSAADTIG